jgi:hypothetical protein
MNDKDLLQQECQFHQNIPLHETTERTRRPLIPNGAEIEPIVGILPEVLQKDEIKKMSALHTPHFSNGKYSNHKHTRPMDQMNP